MEGYGLRLLVQDYFLLSSSRAILMCFSPQLLFGNIMGSNDSLQVGVGMGKKNHHQQKGGSGATKKNTTTKQKEEVLTKNPRCGYRRTEMAGTILGYEFGN